MKSSVGDQIPRDERDALLNYGTQWFNYHAQQRIQTFNFFLVMQSALIVAYASLYGHTSHVLLGIVALQGFFITFPFYALEVRNAELVLNGRYLLDKVEDRYAISADWLPRGRDKKRIDLDIALSLKYPPAPQHDKAPANEARGRSLVRHQLIFRLFMGASAAFALAIAIWTFGWYQPNPSSSCSHGSCAAHIRALQDNGGPAQ